MSLRGRNPSGLPVQAPRATPVTPLGDRSQGTRGHPGAALPTSKMAWRRWAPQKSPKNLAIETTVPFIATAFALSLPLPTLKEPETVGTRNCREEK